MTLNEREKVNYIKNTFHQYFDIKLNMNVETNESVNLVIPIDTLTKEKSFTHRKTYDNVQEILNKYEETNYEQEIECSLVRVIDGDTIIVDIVEGDEIRRETVRLVGVNTPEIKYNSSNEIITIDEGGDVSKEFLTEAIELEDYIYLNVDKKKERDSYNRLLAVLIIQNKNINEILLREGLAEIWYLPPSEFNPYEWGDINTHIHQYESQNDDITELAPYFNSDMTNIVFTSQNNYNVTYKFEVYKDVIYVRLKPFSQNIRMHILPKSYDCSDTILFFKDNMITEENIKITNDYHHYPERSYINSYYHINGIDRDRDDISIENRNYNFNDWIKTFCEFSYDITESTKFLNNIQICCGYKYNKSTPYYSIHYTGIKDNTNIAIEDRCTLIDANYDDIQEKPNNITQYHYDSNKVLYIPKANRDIRAEYGDLKHTLPANIGKLYRKTIKYINDNLYSEEDKKFAIADWKDLSKD